MLKIVSDPLPDPNSGSGILHLAPRVKDRAIFIYKCIKASNIIDFIGSKCPGMIKINFENYAGICARTCIRLWHLSPGTQSERPGYIYL